MYYLRLSVILYYPNVLNKLNFTDLYYILNFNDISGSCRQNAESDVLSCRIGFVWIWGTEVGRQMNPGSAGYKKKIFGVLCL